MNCELFESCKKTKYATQVTAMNNAIGFTAFQGTQAYHKIPLWIDIYFNNTIGMNFTNNACDYYPNNHTLYGFNITEKCHCNSCNPSCTFDSNPSMAVLEGFGYMKVLTVYLIVAVCTLIVFFAKRYKKSKSHPVDIVDPLRPKTAAIVREAEVVDNSNI
jgi:hypothetical protein